MPLPTIPGVVRCAIQGTVPGGQQWANIVHARYSGGASSPGDSDITALDVLLLRVWSGAAFGGGRAWLTNCATTVTITRASYIRLDGSSLGLDLPKALAGTGGGSSLPTECAPVLTIRSNQRGRSRRGRIFLPCPVVGAVDALGQLVAANRNDLITQWNGVVAALGGASSSPFWELGVASYKYGYFTPVAAVTMDPYVDVQTRRRKQRPLTPEDNRDLVGIVLVVGPATAAVLVGVLIWIFTRKRRP